MTASERLFEWVDRLGAELARIGPAGLAINLGATVLAVAAAWVLSRGLRRLVRRGLRRFPGPSNAEKHVRGARALGFTSAVLNLFIVAGAILAVAAIWGVDVAVWLFSGMGGELAQMLLRAGLILLATVLALEAAGYLINQAISRLAARSADRRRAAQLNTFGPLLRGAAQTAIVVVAALTLLGDLGVRIGPLLAGAGVLGVALGFGAQTVVRDLLTGFFLLIEDILAVGDIVRIGDSAGLVEAMTLRTIRLRDFDGTLHVVPYGEAQVVRNLTKTFSYYVFELQVSYGSDIDRALDIMRETGAQLQADPDFRDRILEPIEVAGVDNLAESGVVLKARIKTRPIEQWNVGRAYNRRIKLAFDREGVEIPFPHLKVVLPDRQVRMMAAQDGARAAH